MASNVPIISIDPQIARRLDIAIELGNCIIDLRVIIVPLKNCAMRVKKPEITFHWLMLENG